MGITAKELAKELGLSQAAVSMALNNKPGVSTQTRQRVWDYAKERGYDLSRHEEQPQSHIEQGTIALLVYRKHGAVVTDTPFFYELISGIEAACRQNRYLLNVYYLTEELGIQAQLARMNYCNGIILLATEMKLEDFLPFQNLKIPIVVLDAYYEQLEYDCVLINNFQGAFVAANYVMRKTKAQAGYLRSSYSIANFEERADGFYKAVRENGYSASKSQVLRLAPSVDGAYHDMLQLLEQGETPARCYFADNDLIAAGALKALNEMGYAVGREVSIVGFDNMPICESVSPGLSTVHVPKQYMGSMAVERLLQRIHGRGHQPVKLEIRTSLVKRKSV